MSKNIDVNADVHHKFCTKIGAVAWILECLQTSVVCFEECLTSGLRHEINAY